MKKIALILIILTVVLISFLTYEFYLESLPNDSERKFIQSIQSHLKNPYDWANLSDIHPGNWTDVCFIPSMSTGGGNNKDNIRKIFNIQTKEINLPNGVPIASDWNSAAMFFYPPNTVEGFEIPNKVFSGFWTQVLESRHWCRRKKSEALLIYTVSQSSKDITVITLKQLDKTLQFIKGEN